MTEVDLTNEDYAMLEAWFERLHGKKDDATKKELFLYSKLLVLHDSYNREKSEFKDLMTEK